MDFLFTPEQDEAATLAAQIIGDGATPDRLRATESEAGNTGRFDRALWADLADAGLLGLHLPEAYDGAGLGLIELARVQVEVGRKVAPVPLAVVGAASAFLAEADDDVRGAWLPGLADGSKIVTAAVAEEHDHLPSSPTVTAATDSTLSGTKTLVRAGMYADALLVTAADADGLPTVWLVAGDAPGMTRSAQHTSDRDVTALVTFSNTPATRLGGAEAATRLGELLTVTAAAELLGVTEGGLALTAAYAKTREQFKRPIGTFQAVSQRLADGFIDVLAQRLCLWQAVWRVAQGLPAATEVAVAKLWAADAAHRLAHTTVHVHGGVGIDLDGEAHRYFTAAKRFEFAFGGATEQALRIGAALASA